MDFSQEQDFPGSILRGLLWWSSDSWGGMLWQSSRIMLEQLARRKTVIFSMWSAEIVLRKILLLGGIQS
jgi:hypothetical protein